MRRKTRELVLGNRIIGGEHPILIQTMTNTDTCDVESTIAQINKLEQAGCEAIRVAVLDMEAAEAISQIKTQIRIPLIADIHFDYKLALTSIKSGADGIRINPGNIGAAWKIKEVVSACRDYNIPIRIGVNAGSLEKKLLDYYGQPCAEAMVESAEHNLELLEAQNFFNTAISLKSSSVMMTVHAYELMAARNDYPLHLGVTEAGTLERGLIKSSLGLGILLTQGIGDTIRISLTADPIYEVWAAYELLRNLGLSDQGAELISCPTCGRCQVDLIKIANIVDEKLRTVRKPVKIAVMGCVVNGPGEARGADLGLAGGKGQGLIFRKNEIIRKLPEDEMVSGFLAEIDKLLQEDEPIN